MTGPGFIAKWSEALFHMGVLLGWDHLEALVLRRWEQLLG